MLDFQNETLHDVQTNSDTVLLCEAPLSFLNPPEFANLLTECTKSSNLPALHDVVGHRYRTVLCPFRKNHFTYSKVRTSTSASLQEVIPMCGMFSSSRLPSPFTAHRHSRHFPECRPHLQRTTADYHCLPVSDNFLLAVWRLPPDPIQNLYRQNSSTKS